ncbi:acyl-CoA reductase [Marinigracilibium pacificum]|uniref:Acyl-CoA reductase n=1 Tax=Marinigracilibium pacificum TaxID=2729599 RepID=A0A848J019_9BACT|nr:acyl-CoA reductase [Marinigracilibium pacificum]NMM49196.1 acyl-CoA reductase [Marinigracilibium pacificum]
MNNPNLESYIKLGEELENLDQETLENLAFAAGQRNPWFTYDSVKKAISGIAHILNKKNLIKWLDAYPSLPVSNPKKIGIVMAGNIPAVGFHDLLSILLSGHHAKIKYSSQDQVVIDFILNKLFNINPQLSEKVEVIDKLSDFDAVIATGSDNTGRYFDYYFGKYPNIIRRNRTSIGILNGNESEEELKALGEDIFTYFGLGCRNVSMLMVPKGYNFEKFFESIESYNTIINHHKYSNNYDYNKSIYLVNKEDHLDNGFLLLKKTDEEIVSPISVVYYKEYANNEELNSYLENVKEKIQCIVGKDEQYIEFGEAQKPNPWDYADNVDTLYFLSNLK